MNGLQPNAEIPRVLKCVGAIVYYTDEQPTSYVLTIRDVGRSRNRIHRQGDAGNGFRLCRSLRNVRDDPENNGIRTGRQKHGITCGLGRFICRRRFFWMIFAGVSGCVDFYLWKYGVLAFTVLGIWIGSAAVLAIQGGAALGPVLLRNGFDNVICRWRWFVQSSRTAAQGTNRESGDSSGEMA